MSPKPVLPAPDSGVPFTDLDFPGRATVTVWEIAAKLGVSRQHIWEHIEAGTLAAVDTKIATSRGNLRVPVEEYRRWLLARLTGPARRTFFGELPAATLRQIADEVSERLNSNAGEPVCANSTASSRKGLR